MFLTKFHLYMLQTNKMVRAKLQAPTQLTLNQWAMSKWLFSLFITLLTVQPVESDQPSGFTLQVTENS